MCRERPRLRGSYANTLKIIDFVDHVGSVCPSGFLPMPRNNVRGPAGRD